MIEIILPEGLEKIPDYTLWTCKSLSELVVPEGVTTIEYCAFGQCTAMERIYLPKSVTVIEQAAFYMCKSLKEIYFEGTKEEWEAIQIAEKDNEKLFNVTVIFEYTKDSIAE